MSRLLLFAGFSHLFLLLVNADFHEIPYNAQLTRISNETSEHIKEICGKSTSNILNAPTGRKYPWAVSITLYGLNNQGGVIISPFHILTAAHPFLIFDKSQIGACFVTGYKTVAKVSLKTIRIGSDCTAIPGSYSYSICQAKHMQRRNIKTVVFDRRFGDRFCIDGHDWAILELDQPLIFDENVAPICLPNKTTTIAPSLLAVGWGRPKIYQSSSPIIREIPLTHDPNCTPVPGDSMPTKAKDYLCAKSLEPFNKNTVRICHGDSGGALQKQEKDRSILVGIISFGSELCEADQLTRFTTVSHYNEEICKLTGVCYME